jgi:Zn-dependent protease
MRQSLSLGRVFGIDVRVHASWLLAFAFVTWGLASGYFRFIAPRQGLATPLLLGAISALLLFLSVLIHEFSHSLVARGLGMRVRDITLFIFGGVSNIGGEARTARDEFLVAVVGPLTSFALAGLFWLIARSFGASNPFDLLFGSIRGLRVMTAPQAILNYLTAINLLLGAFNLVPAFPLDGGRVFRSIVWAITRRLGRATTIATAIGQLFGFLIIGLGIVRIAFGDVFGGLWSIFIGWFLARAASASRQDRALRDGLQGVPVLSVMDGGIPVVDQRLSVDQVVHEYFLRTQRRRLIAAAGGVPVGVVDASAVNSVPRQAWATTPVSKIITPVPYTVSPETDAGELLSRLDEQDALVPVVEQGVIVGAVDLMRLMRFAQLRDQLQVQVSSTRPSTA